MEYPDSTGGSTISERPRHAPLGSPAAATTAEAASLNGATGASTIQLPLRECLLPWLDVFRFCSTKWGLVTDVRADGTTYKRHGIIVDLQADISQAVEALDSSLDWKLRRIRQAIDLVKLALAVDPHALVPLMRRRSPNGKTGDSDDQSDSELDKETLQALARGDAPFELRMCLMIHTKKLRFDWGMDDFMQTMDRENALRSRTSSTVLRNYLVDQARSKPSFSRLTCLPIPTTLFVEPLARRSEYGTMNEERCAAFFRCCAKTIAALHSYQSRRTKNWSVNKRLAPLEVEAIELDLEAVPLTAAVIEAVRESMGKGIPVSCPSVCLDFQRVWCREAQLDAFLAEIVDSKSDSLVIYTGQTSDEYDVARFDDEEDAATIRMILRCVGRLRHDIVIDIGRLFKNCTLRANQRAAMCGFLEFVCTREFATRLSVEDCEIDGTTVDLMTRLIRQHARESREIYPLRRRHLTSLEWSPRAEGTSEIIRALLQALDDVEEVHLEAQDHGYNDEDVRTILRYPSLRSLQLERPLLSSLDIFHTSTTGQQLPALECLHLNGLSLNDSTSVIRLLEGLDPRGPKPSALSSTLRDLCIAESDYTGDTSDTNSVRRAIYDPAAGKTLRKILIRNSVLQNVNFIGDFSNYPVTLFTGRLKRSTRKGHIPAPDPVRRSDLSKAQRAAFLSTVRDGNCTASHQVDSNVIRLIFDFAAPHVYRCIRI